MRPLKSRAAIVRVVNAEPRSLRMSSRRRSQRSASEPATGDSTRTVRPAVKGPGAIPRPAAPRPRRSILMPATLGLLGGMGPLASAEFIATLYHLNLVEPEQESPSCILLSDPTFPDRTEAILAGDTGLLALRLEQALQRLVDLGADWIVIACVTIHHVLPQVREPLRR